jgi:predicted enzyme related to lactoylglutathione lyase
MGIRKTTIKWRVFIMGKHSIVHIEIPASDPKEGAQFYSDLFDWKTSSSPFDGGFEYWQFEPEAGPGGGFNALSEGSPESGFGPVKPGDVLIYVSTDDIEATLAKAVSLGGTIVDAKMEIPGIGWFGTFTDPTGNKIGVYTSKAQVE